MCRHVVDRLVAYITECSLITSHVGGCHVWYHAFNTKCQRCHFACFSLGMDECTQQSGQNDTFLFAYVSTHFAVVSATHGSSLTAAYVPAFLICWSRCVLHDVFCLPCLFNLGSQCVLYAWQASSSRCACVVAVYIELGLYQCIEYFLQLISPFVPNLCHTTPIKAKAFS
jgi:hypothetical protein